MVFEKIFFILKLKASTLKSIRFKIYPSSLFPFPKSTCYDFKKLYNLTHSTEWNKFLSQIL